MKSRLVLRPLAVEDAHAMSVVLADPSLYEFFGGEPTSVAELERRYAFQTRGDSRMVPCNGDPAEIEWVIGQPWQGHGYATETARMLVEHLTARGISVRERHHRRSS